MTAPEITAAIDALIASTPPPVTVWGVRYPHGGIQWLVSEAEARDWVADCGYVGRHAELVRVTGRVHVEG